MTDQYILAPSEIVRTLYRVTYSYAAIYGPNDPETKELLDILTRIDPRAGEQCGDDIAIDIIGG